MPPDIKQEEEEESVTQRGDLMDFTDQDHYKTEMEENQNQEYVADNPVKKEEPDSPRAVAVRELTLR